MLSPSRSFRLHTWYSYTASVVIVSLLSWTTGISPHLILRASAAQLQTISDTLSTSAPGVAANHSIRFVTPSGIAADGSTLVVEVPGGFDVSAITEDDVDIADDGVDLTTAASCGAVQAAVTVSGQNITIEICSGGGGAIAASSVVTIEVGTNATASGTGANRITNHVTQGDYVLGVTGTMSDEGYTRLVILDSVTVSGEVATYFEFTVAGVNASSTVNGDALATFATTTATSVPFGTLAPNVARVMAQDLAVVTNSLNGFTITVEAASNLLSTSGATINSFTDGTNVAVPTAWVAPTGTTGVPDTYGHWGLTTEDASLTDNDSFGTALYVGNFIQNPREVMHATSSADGTTPNIGATRVGYKIEISTLQEAARDYTTSLTYVATPIF